MPTHRWGDYTPSGHLGRILDDKTPQLGGMLDGNGFTFNGAIAFEAKAGEALSKGNAVYVSGVSGNKPVVMKADADDAAKMPTFGIAETDTNLNANVNVVTFGTVYEIDTSAYSAGDELYVSTTAGELTATKPSGATTKLQNIGKVIRSHASAGSIKVGGAGRTNDVPNLDNGTVFIGNAGNQAEQRALTGDDISGGTITSFASTSIDDNATSTAITIDSSENVGIGETDPDTPLHITSGAGDQITLQADSTTIGPNIVFANNDGNLARIASAETNTLRFEVGPSNTEAMRIDSSGNLIVGDTTAGNAKVTSVNGVAFEARDGTQPYYQWYNSAAGTDLKYWRVGNNTNGDLQWQTVNDAYSSATVRMTLDASGGLNVGGSSIGTRANSISVVGDNNSSTIASKTTSYDTVFSVLPWSSSITYLGTGTYYEDGSWVHASDNTVSSLLALAGDGVHWYASSGSTPNFDVASNVPLWNSTGQWDGDINTTYDINTGAIASGKVTVTTASTTGVEIDGSGASSYLYINGPVGNTWFGQNASGEAAIWSSGSVEALTLDSSGNASISKSLTVGDGSNTASYIAIKAADDTTSDELQFYNGTTRIGEIGTQDTTWLRINQETAKNIYTPRYIRADGGFFVDGTAKGINGSGNFIGGTVTTPSLTTETVSGAAIFIKDTSGTGATNHNSWLSFRDSGGTEVGYIGYGSSGDSNLSVSNYSNGPVRLDGTAIIMGTTVQIVDANTTISEGSGNALRFSTNSGYIDIGPMNTGFAHFNTDRAKYYFDKEVQFDGVGIRAYDTGADARFPIYYDSQNTSYYVDPASTSRLNISYNNETSHLSESGRGVKFWNNDYYKIYMSAISDGTWGGDVANANASDYAMYFRMSNGTNRGFIFRNDTTNVAKIDGAGVFSGSGVYSTGEYLDIKYNSTGGGGVRLYDADSTLQGYWYGNGSGEHGLLDNDGAWAVRIRTGTNQLRLQTNNNNECMIYTSYVRAVGSCRAPIFYDFNNTSYYAHLDSTGDSIRAAGDIVAYYSDERLKDIEGPIENALDKVATLDGFYYRGNEKAQKLGYDDKLKVGLSAQEVQKVLPEVIKSCPADSRYMTLDYSKVVPLLVEAIKELKSEIEELKK